MADTAIVTTPAKAAPRKPKFPEYVKSQYELERDARIARNQAFLASIGLGEDGQKLPKKAPRTPKPRAPKRKVPESERRKSSRLAGGVAPVERLEYDPEDFEDRRPAKKVRRAPRAEPSPLTDEQRALLGEWDMEAFYDFLGSTTTYHKEISPDNRRAVIRQVTKLVTGEGVHYDSPSYGWPEHVVFRKDEPVTLQSDIEQIKEDAKAFEDKHGRDHGNGWLLNHPLQKMILFRYHLAEEKLSKPAKKGAKGKGKK
mmetsp:Transcript_23262/g.69674  ORF Transcript_23262/g.69674 Transcript_23262/m.69674 type:complete len:256 (-) Transcript_23262:41-808(-)